MKRWVRWVPLGAMGVFAAVFLVLGREMRLFAVYSGDRAAGESWQAQVRAAFPEREVELAALPLSICCHIGSGALAIACAEV